MRDKKMFEALHPDPAKQGARVTEATYEAYREALLKLIPNNAKGVELCGLSEAVRPLLTPELIENTAQNWWVMTVKLDLEARGIIEQVPGKGRQRLRKTA